MGDLKMNRKNLLKVLLIAALLMLHIVASAAPTRPGGGASQNIANIGDQ